MKGAAAGAIVLVAFVLLPLVANGQRKRETPVVFWVDWDCLTSEYPRQRLNRVVGKAADEFGNGYVAKWGDRALAFDLSGDRKPEYFIPLGCSAVGNCSWGIFALAPARLVGVVEGKEIYIRKRAQAWSSLVTYGHNSASDGFITNYVFRRRRYVKLPGSLHVYALPNGVNSYPRFMETIRSPCAKSK